MSQNVSSAVLVIGVLRVKEPLNITTRPPDYMWIYISIGDFCVYMQKAFKSLVLAQIKVYVLDFETFYLNQK